MARTLLSFLVVCAICVSGPVSCNEKLLWIFFGNEIFDFINFRCFCFSSLSVFIFFPGKKSANDSDLETIESKIRFKVYTG